MAGPCRPPRSRAQGRRRPAGGPEPPGPPRLRHPRDLRGRHRAGRQRGQVAARGQGPAARQLRPGASTARCGCTAMHVPPYAFASGFGATDPDRRRKLLLHRRQIDELRPAHHPGLAHPGPAVGVLQGRPGQGRPGPGQGPQALRQAARHRGAGDADLEARRASAARRRSLDA